MSPVSFFLLFCDVTSCLLESAPLCSLASAPWLTDSFRAMGRSGAHSPGQSINISSRSRSQGSHWAMHNHESNSGIVCSLHTPHPPHYCTPTKHLNTVFLTTDSANLEGLKPPGNEPVPTPICALRYIMITPPCIIRVLLSLTGIPKATDAFS